MVDKTEYEMRWAIWLLIILVATGAAMGGAKIDHPWSGAFVGLALWALVMLISTCFVVNKFIARARAGMATLAAAGLVVLVFVVDFDFDARSLGVMDAALTGNGGVNFASSFDCTLYNGSDFNISEASIAVQTFNPKNPNQKSDVRQFDIPLHLKPRTTQDFKVPTGLQADYGPAYSYRRERQVETSWWILRFKVRTNLYHYLISPASKFANQSAVVIPPPLAPVVVPPAPTLPTPPEQTASSGKEKVEEPKLPSPPPPPPRLPTIAKAHTLSDRVEENNQDTSRTALPLGYFTIGSSKDEVFAAQGTPTKLGLRQWEYGYSRVEFDHEGRVTGWYNSPVNLLKVKMLPMSSSPKSYFTVGSSKDEVLATQGTPTKPGLRQWEYGYSRVEFDSDGRVTSWYSSAVNPLKVRYEPQKR